MSLLVDQLKKDHVNLGAFLDEVKAAGITSDKGRAKLMSAKKLLLAHLAREDAELYPKLRQAAKTDKRLATMIDSFVRDMEGIYQAAVAFFEKYEKGGDNLAFAMDYGKIIGALTSRIQREETILFPEYDKLA